jgi:hypothetical protein
MTKPRYRICSRCGKSYNVSLKAENTKKYTCPPCYYYMRKEKERCIDAYTAACRTIT